MIHPRTSDNVSGSGCLLQEIDDVSSCGMLLSVNRLLTFMRWDKKTSPTIWRLSGVAGTNIPALATSRSLRSWKFSASTLLTRSSRSAI